MVLSLKQNGCLHPRLMRRKRFFLFSKCAQRFAASMLNTHRTFATYFCDYIYGKQEQSKNMSVPPLPGSIRQIYFSFVYIHGLLIFTLFNDFHLGLHFFQGQSFCKPKIFPPSPQSAPSPVPRPPGAAAGPTCSWTSPRTSCRGPL